MTRIVENVHELPERTPATDPATNTHVDPTEPNMHGREVDAATGTPTTGHEWDGIRELDTPMPRWWLWTLYGTIAWALVYYVLFPAFPLVNEATPGLLGYSSREAVESEIERVAVSRADVDEAIATLPLEAVRADDRLFAFAVRGGQSNFKLVCAQCHGSGAAGSEGYPNLNDDDWLWGGTLDEIYHTIAHGIRNGDPDSHYNFMPAYGVDGLLGRDDIAAVTETVLQLSGQEHDAELALAGATIFAEQCSSCHGEGGEGITDLGAPNLTDAIWLYGGTREEVYRQIWRPRHGAMPPWNERFTDAQVRKLAVYVHSLGGGVREGVGEDGGEAPAEVPVAAEPGGNL